MHACKVGPGENCIIEPGPRKVKPSQEPAYEHETSQIRDDSWMSLTPLVPEVFCPSPQRFLEDLQMLFVSAEHRLAS